MGRRYWDDDDWDDWDDDDDWDADDIEDLVDDIEDASDDGKRVPYYILRKLGYNIKKYRYFLDEDILDDFFDLAEYAIGSDMLDDLWNDFFDEDWDDRFWKTKGHYFPVRISKSISSELKGTIGESIVSDILSNLPSEKYYVMNDLLLEIGNKTAQIDHVVISVYGIFVIETKNYSGVIIGNENDKKWIQITSDNTQYEFYNPIRQNRNHCRAISECLEFGNPGYYIPITVFLPGCELQVETRCPVIYTDNLLEFIGKYKHSVIRGLTAMDFYKKIKDSCNSTYKARQKHIENIKRDKF